MEDYEVRIKLQTANHMIEGSIFSLKHAAFCLHKAMQQSTADKIDNLVEDLQIIYDENAYKITLSYNTKKCESGTLTCREWGGVMRTVWEHQCAIDDWFTEAVRQEESSWWSATSGCAPIASWHLEKMDCALNNACVLENTGLSYLSGRVEK